MENLPWPSVVTFCIVSSDCVNVRVTLLAGVFLASLCKYTVPESVLFPSVIDSVVTVKFKSTWVDNNLLYISRIETLLKEYDSGEKSPIINDVFCGCIAEKVLSLLSVYFFHKDNPKKQSQVYRELDEFSQNRYLQKALCSLNNPLYTLKQKVILWCLKKRMYFVLKCLVFLNSKLKLLRRK